MTGLMKMKILKCVPPWISILVIYYILGLAVYNLLIHMWVWNCFLFGKQGNELLKKKLSWPLLPVHNLWRINPLWPNAPFRDFRNFSRLWNLSGFFSPKIPLAYIRFTMLENHKWFSTRISKRYTSIEPYSVCRFGHKNVRRLKKNLHNVWTNY